MANNSCCAGGTWLQQPVQEPNVLCQDQQRGDFVLFVDPRAAILLGRFGVDPCDVPHAGDRVRPQDAENYLKQQQYIGA